MGDQIQWIDGRPEVVSNDRLYLRSRRTACKGCWKVIEWRELVIPDGYKGGPKSEVTRIERRDPKRCHRCIARIWERERFKPPGQRLH